MTTNKNEKNKQLKKMDKKIEKLQKKIQPYLDEMQKKYEPRFEKLQDGTIKRIIIGPEISNY